MTGDQGRTRSISEEVFAQAAEPKKRLVVAGVRHIDLYDDTALVPFDEIVSLLHEHLAA